MAVTATGRRSEEAQTACGRRETREKAEQRNSQALHLGTAGAKAGKGDLELPAGPGRAGRCPGALSAFPSQAPLDSTTRTGGVRTAWRPHGPRSWMHQDAAQNYQETETGDWGIFRQGEGVRGTTDQPQAGRPSSLLAGFEVGSWQTRGNDLHWFAKHPPVKRTSFLVSRGLRGWWVRRRLRAYGLVI